MWYRPALLGFGSTLLCGSAPHLAVDPLLSGSWSGPAPKYLHGNPISTFPCGAATQAQCPADTHSTEQRRIFRALVHQLSEIQGVIHLLRRCECRFWAIFPPHTLIIHPERLLLAFGDRCGDDPSAPRRIQTDERTALCGTTP